MFVVEVIPLDTGAGVDRLSYFSSVDYPRGTIVAVPVRSREVDAIVMSTMPVSTLKTALRAATFTLRKLPAGIERGRVADSFLALIDTIAAARALAESDVLTALIPKRREYVAARGESLEGRALTPLTPHVEIIAATTAERYTEYKRIVRESFAAGGSVLFVAPTLRDASRAVRELALGIEDYVLVLRSDAKASDQKKTIAKLSAEHPVLIVTTPAYAHVERADIRTTILESARSKAYRGIARPYLDHRYAIMEHARLRGAGVVLGDLILPAEDVERFRARSYDYVGHGEFPKRLDLPSTIVVVHQKKDPDGIVPFTLFSPELMKAMERTIAKKERMFLLSARRGIAPVVACADCGHIFRDPESGAPLSLIRTIETGAEQRYLISSTSGHREQMPDTCPECNSWRLRERGIGVQHIESELRKRIEEIPLFILDHATATTHTKADAIARSFYESERGGILLGTSLAIPYLERAVERSAIVSMDSLLSLPSWRQQEEALGTLLALRERTKKEIIAQTRHRPDDRVLALASRADLGSFYDEELEARLTFSYPPYAVFILLSYKGSREAISATEAMLTEKFGTYGISLYGMPPADVTHVLRRGLLRFPRESWPDPAVVALLRDLPPSIKIEFDPDRIV